MTPMTEIEKLKDGVYEKVMSRRFAEVLKEALAEDQVRAEEEDVDAEEAVGYLSSYLQQVIRLCLKDIADRDEENSVDHQLALTNELIASLAKKTEELGGGQEVANAPFLLRSLEHKKNTLLPRRWERPATSLTRSFLFTNSKKDVSMVHELTKEIASSDRIDFLISFIRFSGLQLLLPALRLFTARGGHLRIVTTTYMGATDPKAIEVLASLPHTEVRISYDVKETRLHAKSYMFYRESGYSTAYIGSSNLSHAAIAEGMEWNMKVTAQDQPHIIDKMSATFETYWHSEDFTPTSPKKMRKNSVALSIGNAGGAAGQMPPPMLLTSSRTPTSRRYWMHLIQSGTAKIAGTILSSPLQARERQRSPPSTIADLPPREKKGRASSSSLIGKRS